MPITQLTFFERGQCNGGELFFQNCNNWFFGEPRLEAVPRALPVGGCVVWVAAGCWQPRDALAMATWLAAD